MADFLPPPALTAWLDWPKKSKIELRELPVTMKSYKGRWSWQIPVGADSRITFFTWLSLIYKDVNRILYMFVNYLLCHFSDKK